MKVAIYSDRLLSNFFGGAEIYSIRLAFILSEHCEVTIFCNKSRNLSKVEVIRKQFPELQNVKIVQISGVGDYGHPAHREWLVNRIFNMIVKANFDLFINISNNLVGGVNDVPSIAIIHFPIPLNTPKTKFSFTQSVNNHYLNSYNIYLGNSKYTRDYIQQVYNKNTDYIYPPISDPLKNQSSHKTNTIVYVGRIDPDKQIEELINAFKQLNKQGWNMIIAGFCSNTNYLERLNAASKNFNIQILENVSDEKLTEVFNQAKIYWHSKGYKQTRPDMMEHFGMSTVEAMSYACVPVTFNGGGQREIVTESCGYLWNTPDELIEDTNQLIDNPTELNKMSKACITRSKDFSYGAFWDEFEKIINKVVPKK